MARWILSLKKGISRRIIRDIHVRGLDDVGGDDAGVTVGGAGAAEDGDYSPVLGTGGTLVFDVAAVSPPIEDKHPVGGGAGVSFDRPPGAAVLHLDHNELGAQTADGLGSGDVIVDKNLMAGGSDRPGGISS